MEPFNHPKPQMPAHLRDRHDEYALLNRALASAMAGRTATAMGQVELLRQQMAERLAHPLTQAQRMAEDRYNLEVRKYNEAVETAKVRAAACPSCFSTHAGEC